MIKQKRGISLVALIITIIVLIILTATVIITMNNENIIGKANEAVKRSDYAALVDCYELKYGEEKFKVELESGGKINEINALNEATKAVKLDKDFEFTNDNDSVVYTGENEYIREWINNKFIYKELAGEGYSFSTINDVTYITGMKIEGNSVVTTASDILNKLGEGYSIIDNTGNLVSGESKVTTGYKIKKGGEDYLTIIVRGDLYVSASTGDTYINGNDISTLQDIILGIEITQEEFLAADLNNDGIISIDDGNIMLLILLNYIEDNEVEQLQLGISTKIPEISNKTIYTWYENDYVTEKLTAIDEIYEEDGFLYITIPEGITTLSELQNYIRIKTGINVDISGNLFSLIENEEHISISIPWKISDTEYCKEPDAVLFIK